MSGGSGQPEIEILCQLKETVELMLSKMFGTEADIIVDVPLRLQIAAQTVAFALTRRSRILDVRF